VAECWSSKHKALSSNPSTTKKREGKEEGREEEREEERKKKNQR
jgi:hypothetical protein